MGNTFEEHDKLYRRRGVRPRHGLAGAVDKMVDDLKKMPPAEHIAQAHLYIEHMKERGEDMETSRVEPSVHEKIEELASDRSIHSGDELEKIVTAAFKALLRGVDTGQAAPPALFYLGTDEKIYRVDQEGCTFPNGREAALADALIVAARSIVQSNRDRLRPPRTAPGYEPYRLASEALPKIRTRAVDGVDKDWAMIIGRSGEEQIRLGFIMEGTRFAYDEDDGRRRVTNHWRPPMPGTIFARVLDGPKDSRNRVFEGTLEGTRFNFCPRISTQISTKNFEVVAEPQDY